MDIWEIYRALTHKKYKYFLTIVDDHTNATWTYLLQYKSDALDAIKIFHKMVVVQFDSHIKVIRLDNALVFESEPCRLFFVELGLSHQTS